jgi:putative DNA methylase
LRRIGVVSDESAFRPIAPDLAPQPYLSDFFYVWLRRSMVDVHPQLVAEPEVPKAAEIVVDRPHELSNSKKDVAFYERQLTKAFADGRRVIRPDGIGTNRFREQDDG